MTTLLTIYAFALGAVIGSFLNVVIYRWPREESIVFPPSHCPNCGARIRPWDNVPIVSWILLLGRCRSCRQPISARYPTIELVNGLFFAAVFLHSGIAIDFLLLATICSMLIVLIYIDLDIQLLPDVVDIPGIGVGLLMGALGAGRAMPELVISDSLLDSVIGAAAGAGIIFAVGMAYKLLRGMEGMGLGDVKMLAMIGAVVGWRAVAPVIFGASFVGAIFGLVIAAKNRQGLQFALPFGVFLGLSTFATIFFGHTLLEWYRSLLLG
ncbi:MAG: prepilin peptidase [Thermoanaerobaculia bacterium]